MIPQMIPRITSIELEGQLEEQMARVEPFFSFLSMSLDF
jgi:hypothetical protein